MKLESELLVIWRFFLIVCEELSHTTTHGSQFYSRSQHRLHTVCVTIPEVVPQWVRANDFRPYRWLPSNCSQKTIADTGDKSLLLLGHLQGLSVCQRWSAYDVHLFPRSAWPGSHAILNHWQSCADTGLLLCEVSPPRAYILAYLLPSWWQCLSVVQPLECRSSLQEVGNWG